MSRFDWATHLAGFAVLMVLLAELDYLLGGVTYVVIKGGIAAIIALILLAMAASR